MNDDIKKHIAFRAMTYGSAAAFLCITKHGAMPSMPKSDVVDEFIAKYWKKYYKYKWNIISIK